MGRKASAPKAKAAVARPSKKAKAAPKAAPPGSTLIVQDEAAEHSDKVANQAKEKKEETLDQKVARCLRDNFKGWSWEKTDGAHRNGMSLRARIRHDKEQAALGDKRVQFGKYYFAELRTVYGSDSDPEKLINVKDEGVLCDSRLQEALTGLFEKKLRTSPLASVCLTIWIFAIRPLLSGFSGRPSRPTLARRSLATSSSVL